MKRTLLAAAAALMPTLPASAQMQGYPGSYGEHMWGGGWHGWLLGPLMMLVWLALIVGAIVLVLRLTGVTGQHGKAASRSDAMDILRERFARGEIDKAEFEERRALLER